MEYPLPDKALFDEPDGDAAWMIWQPESTCLVLGASNQPETSLHLDLVEQDNIAVYKRPSGGETVILTPKTLVISVRLPDQGKTHPQVFFKAINHSIIRVLKELGIQDPGQKGISDITLGELKILGSSIYRKKQMVFYHAVLNIKESTETIARYIRHPRREPDYRRGRDHGAFVTSLAAQGYHIDMKDLISRLDRAFEMLKELPL